MRLLRSEQLSWWIVELCHALDVPGERLDHGSELGLVDALNDAMAWTSDPRPYDEKLHDAPWKSVIADFEATVRRVGPASALGRTINTEAQAAVAQLQLPTAADYARVKRNASAALDAMSTRLARSDAVVAAWDDLVAASKDDTVLAPEWTWRRNLFLELAAHAGRPVPSLAITLAGIIDDRLLEATEARARVGDIAAPPRGGWPSLDEEAGLDEDERTSLCARLIAVEPRETRCIVCVGFDHARLDAPIGLGPAITFYPAAQARAQVGAGDVAELGSIALVPREASPKLPDGDDEVVAIVDLGTANPATAVGVASGNCQAVVALVNAGLRRPSWRPMTGHVLYAEGWSLSTSTFARSDRALRRFVPSDPTASRLASLGGQLGGHLPVTAPLLQSVIAASNRLLSAQNNALDPAGKLLLTVGVVEDAAAWVPAKAKKWFKLAADFDAAWAEESMKSDIFKVVTDALALHGFQPEVNDEDELRRLRGAIVIDRPDGTFEVDMPAAIQAVPGLAAIHEVGSANGRRLATARAFLKDPASLARNLSGRCADYKRLLDRAVRCRNAAAHGGPLPIATVQSVLDWASTLASTLRVIGLDAMLGGSGDPRSAIAAKYQRLAEDARKRRSALAGGAAIISTLFPSGAATQP